MTEFLQHTVDEFEKSESNRRDVLTVATDTAELLLEICPVEPSTGSVPKIISVIDTVEPESSQILVDNLDLLEALGGRSAMDGFHISRNDLLDVRDYLRA